MTVAEPNKVDIIARKPSSNVVKLVIADHLPWEDVHAHKLLIQEKVNTYIHFVESGQINAVREPEIPSDPDVTIRLALKHRPPSDAVEFLEQVNAFLLDNGLQFEWEVEDFT